MSLRIVCIWVLAPIMLLSAACGESCGSDTEEDEVELGGRGSEPRVVELVLPQAPADGTETDPLSRPRPEMRDVLRVIDNASERKEVKGLFLRLGPFGDAWGRAADLSTALARVRDEGKPVHCHFQRADNVTYYLLASGCDRISMTPAGHLDLVGPSAHVFYARTLLEHIGLEAQLMQMGRYKSAGDALMRKEMPDATREALGTMLDDLHSILASAIKEGRELSAERARELIDGGPYGSDRARGHKLVDDVGFDDEAREHARRAGKADRVHETDLVPKPKPIGLGDLLEVLAGKEPSGAAEGARVGLVYLNGAISEGERSGLRGVQSGPFVEAVRDMADDDAVKSVVLRIDSPGGSALASDRMWHAVRRAAERKPVIASIGDMAASGGYYVASAADEIYAHDGSLVGAIGVVGGKINVAGAADKLGVQIATLQRGEHATWSSPARPFSERERAIVEKMLQSTYRRFIKRVAEGRGMERDKVRHAAEGRLMTARRGRELGLVDKAAGLDEALTRARERGGLGDEASIQRWPRPKGLLDTLATRLGGGKAATVPGEVLERLQGAGAPVARAALWSMRLGSDRVAVALPYMLRLQ